MSSPGSVKDEIAVILCSLGQQQQQQQQHQDMAMDSQAHDDPAQAQRKPKGRGRRKSDPGLDSDAKKMLRMEGNRQAAKRCRERRKTYILQLETRLRQLEDMNANLAVEINELRRPCISGEENDGKP